MRLVHEPHCSWKHNFSRRATALALLFAPIASTACCTRMLGLILGAFLGEVQTNVSAKEIASTLPSRTIARKLLHEKAVEVLTLVRMNSSGVKT